MQFSGCCAMFVSQKNRLVCCLSIALGACIQPPPKDPVEVCKIVTKSLSGFELPEKVAVSHQEIQGERIVVHLNFKRPADKKPVKAICVYGVDVYRRSETDLLYKQVPTRLAINGKQVTEKNLLKAIRASGFE